MEHPVGLRVVADLVQRQTLPTVAGEQWLTTAATAEPTTAAATTATTATTTAAG